MPTYCFAGRVSPEWSALSFPEMEAEVELSEGQRGVMRLSIVDGQVSIWFDEAEPGTDLLTLKNQAQAVAQGLADSAGYSFGRAFVVEIATATTSESHRVFGNDVEVLRDSQSERPLDSMRVLELSMSNPVLRQALGDLRAAIREPQDTGFHCYRAAETLRQHFEGADDSRAAEWERMRQSLRLSEEFLRRLKRFADLQRHGRQPFMSDFDRAEDLIAIWRVMDRFLVLLDTGARTLPSEEFEIL